MSTPDDFEHYDDSDLDEDYDADMEDCGMMPDGLCSLAGSEWCDWSCSHSKDLIRARIRAMKATQDPTP